MKGILKLLVDIGPLAIFFIFYTRSDLQSAILPFMIATVIAVIFWYSIEKKIPITNFQVLIQYQDRGLMVQLYTTGQIKKLIV